MLETKHDISGRQFAGALERYLGETLHDRVRVDALERTSGLPAFLGRTYSLFEGHIAGRQCIFLAPLNNPATPSDVAKHIGLVRDAFDAIVVFATPSLSAHNRSRLIGQGVPFVVPGNQLYIPDLAMDLREHFRALKHRHGDGLSPAAQAVLFHHLLRLDVTATTPSQIAARLRYSAMSIGRAFDDLIAAGLAYSDKYGKERHIRFNSDGRQLFDAARELLRSPVRAEKFIRDGHVVRTLKRGGESALADLTDLSRPHLETFAVAASAWKAISQADGVTETDRNRADYVVETWSYDPAGLSDTHVVDPLSLYAQFRDHRDERVSMAAERLLERVAW